ncbi:MAG: GNAT family N-acetyltransferase [Gammaproteobacteria bacterium]
MSHYTITIARPEDRMALSVLLQTSYPELMKPAYEPRVLAAALEAMTVANPALLASGTYYVAESATGELIGCGGWTRRAPAADAASSGIGHIRHFATHPAWVRQTIGRAIYAVCQQQASGRGITLLLRHSW